MNVVEEVLPEVTSRVFETMYFCDPVYVGHAAVTGPVFSGVLSFSGCVSGEFHLAIAEALSRELTSVFLTTAPENVSQEQSEANVGELANVLCCAAMNTLLPDAHLTFSVPRLSPAAGLSASLQHCFRVNKAEPEIAISIVFEPELSN